MPDTLGGWLWTLFVLLVGGFGMSLLSVYAKPKIDAVWGKYSEKQRMKNEKEKKLIDAEVALILSDSTEREFHQFDRIQTVIEASASLIITVVTLAVETMFVLSIDISINPNVQFTFQQFIRALLQYPKLIIQFISLLMVIFTQIGAWIVLSYSAKKLIHLMDVIYLARAQRLKGKIDSIEKKIDQESKKKAPRKKVSQSKKG